MLKSADSHMAGHQTPTPLPAPIREMSLRSSPEKSFLSFLGGKKKKRGRESDGNQAYLSPCVLNFNGDFLSSTRRGIPAEPGVRSKYCRYETRLN